MASLSYQQEANMNVLELICALEKVKKENRGATVHIMTKANQITGELHGDVLKVEIIGQHTTIVMDVWS